MFKVGDRVIILSSYLDGLNFPDWTGVVAKDKNCCIVRCDHNKSLYEFDLHLLVPETMYNSELYQLMREKAENV